MTNNVYVLYNKESLRYGDVMAYPTDGFALARLQEGLKPSMLSELELCRIGTIDIDTGVIVPSGSPVRIAWREQKTLPVSKSQPLTN